MKKLVALLACMFCCHIYTISQHAGLTEIRHFYNLTGRSVEVINTEIGKNQFDTIRKYPGSITIQEKGDMHVAMFIPWAISPSKDNRPGNYLDIFVGGVLEFSLQEDRAQIVINGRVLRSVWNTKYATIVIAPKNFMHSPYSLGRFVCQDDEPCMVASNSSSYVLMLCEKCK